MTHYDEFGLSPTASAEEIQRAHRNLAKLLHPDPIQDEEMRRLAESQLKRLNTIYSVLIDPARRRNYDLQLIRHGPAAEVANRRPPKRRRQLQAPVLVGIISLMAGFQTAVWWGEPRETKERIVYLDRTDAGGLPPSANPAPRGETQPSLADTRELRRILNQVISERDHALARLNSIRSSDVAAPVMSVGGSSQLAAAGGSEAKSAASAASAGEAQTETPNMARPTLAGTWIYSAPPRRSSQSDQYAAEYIELLITERDSRLSGRYRGRYKVPDRAMTPEVELLFEGPLGGERRYAWRGNAGSAGEIHLKQDSENSLSVDWYTSQLGRNPMLGSGTAVLVRRRQD